MASTLRFGILGTGNIAQQFAEGVAGAERSVVTAVGSRRRDTAETFAKAHAVPRAHGDYETLLNDADVDAVYLSLPNSMHHEWTLRALRAGKHVLCEKPLSVTAAEAEEMFDEARRQGRLLVEAFMYRSHPQTRRIVELVRGGAIGELRLIRTSFCFRVRKTEGNIRFSVPLAGGALMDIGCYCVSLSRLIAGGEPTAVHGVGSLHESGVDDYAAGVLRFDGGVLASFTCGMTVQADNTAQVCGSEGYLSVPWPWKPAGPRVEFTLDRQVPPRQDGDGGGQPPRETHAVEVDRPLYALEADDFAAAVLDGAPPSVTRQDSVGNMRVVEQLRQQVGVPF